jgi:hypothetical protein
MAATVTNHWRGSTQLPAAVTAAGSPQQAPLYWRPEWYVGHLVYQGGIPYLPRSPLNGSGFIPYRDGYAGKEAPSWQPYATPYSSMVGAGSLPARPNFLMRLLGGLVTTGQ